MKRSASGLTAVALAILSGSSAAVPETPSGESMAPLWTVHIDEVRPDKAAEFERLNIEENKGLHAILREHGQPIAPVYEIMTTGGVYMSMRPRLSFTEFDTPSSIPESVSKLLAAVTDPLDAPIHAALKYHHNEIWRYHETDSYIPKAPGTKLSTPGYIQIVSERVIPGMEDRYGELLDALNAALKKSNYPWSVLMFTSSYGDGAYKYVWQADSKAAFLNAGDRAAILTAVHGKPAGGQMLADWKRCLASSETVDATPRRDISDLLESVLWLGQPQRPLNPDGRQPSTAPEPLAGTSWQLVHSSVESRGPATWACVSAGENDALRVTYYKTQPAMMLLERGGITRPAFQVSAASGSRYEGDGVLFWEARGEATLNWMGAESTCKVN